MKTTFSFGANCFNSCFCFHKKLPSLNKGWSSHAAFFRLVYFHLVKLFFYWHKCLLKTPSVPLCYSHENCYIMLRCHVWYNEVSYRHRNRLWNLTSELRSQNLKLGCTIRTNVLSLAKLNMPPLTGKQMTVTVWGNWHLSRFWCLFRTVSLTTLGNKCFCWANSNL